jgi:hypothetical protein
MSQGLWKAWKLVSRDAAVRYGVRTLYIQGNLRRGNGPFQQLTKPTSSEHGEQRL